MEPMKDPREVVRKRGQRVHHTKILYSPGYSQYQSSTAPGFLQIAEDVKLNWYLEYKELVHNQLVDCAVGWSVGQSVSWSVGQ